MKFNGALRDSDGWETLSSEEHFANDHLAVATIGVRTPTVHHVREWTVVHRKAAVVIAPMTADGRLVLIRQERIPIRADIWEVPAGQIDHGWKLQPADIEAVALRELREETGYELSASGRLEPLGDFFSSPGFTDEQAYLFLARPVELSVSGSAHDETESILECRTFSAAEIAQMIATNDIRDANTLAVCARLVARGFLVLRD